MLKRSILKAPIWPLKRIYYDYEQFRGEDGPTSLFIKDAEATPYGAASFVLLPAHLGLEPRNDGVRVRRP